MSQEIRVVLVTAPNLEIAQKLAREMVSKKLAACVNIIPNIESVYEWQGKINNDSEILLIIKAKLTNLKRLEDFIAANHPYEVAEFIALEPSYVSEKYKNWVSSS